MSRGDEHPKKGWGAWARIVKSWLELRALPAQILRGRVAAEEVLSLSMIGLMYFLVHWEVLCTDLDEEILIWPFAGMTPLWQERTLWLLVLVLPLNGWWLAAWIGRETGLDATLRPALRCARFALCAIPVLGLAAIPLWRWLALRKPPWAFAAEEKAELFLAGPTSGGARWLADFRRTMARIAALPSPVAMVSLWYFVFNSALLRATVVSLAACDPAMVGPFALLVAALVRGAGLGLTLAYLWRWRRRRGMSKMSILVQGLTAPGWLVPAPMAYFTAFAGLALGAWSSERALVNGAKPSRLRSTREILAVPKNSPWYWRWVLFPRTQTDDPIAARHLAAWARLANLALLFDVAFGTLLLMRLLGRWPGLDPFVAVPLSTCLGLVLIGGLAGGFLGLRELGRKGLRKPSSPRLRSAGSQQLKAALFFLAGIGIGSAAHGGPAEASRLLVLLTMVGMSTALLQYAFGMPFELFARFRKKMPFLRWLRLLIFLAATAAMLQAAEKFSPLLWLTMIAVPVFLHLMSLRYLRWTLLPFRPGDLLRPDLPAETRGRMAAVAVLTVMPFAGLIVPLAMFGWRQLETSFDAFWATADGAAAGRRIGA